MKINSNEDGLIGIINTIPKAKLSVGIWYEIIYTYIFLVTLHKVTSSDESFLRLRNN